MSKVITTGEVMSMYKLLSSEEPLTDKDRQCIILYLRTLEKIITRMTMGKMLDPDELDDDDEEGHMSNHGIVYH